VGDLRWSKMQTHCVVCLRPFATASDEDRHAEQECDDPCWCESLCWIDQGGDCQVPEWLDDDLALWVRLRGAEERIERLEAALVDAIDCVSDPHAPDTEGAAEDLGRLECVLHEEAVIGGLLALWGVR
jgi:hypothetical protein